LFLAEAEEQKQQQLEEQKQKALQIPGMVSPNELPEAMSEM